MGKLKQLLGDVLIYGLSSVVGRFINFLLLPVYTRILSPGDYGVLNIVNTTFSIIWLLAIMALDSAAFVFFYDCKNEKFKKSIYASWFWAQLGVVIIFGLLLFSFSAFLSRIFFHSNLHNVEFILIGIILIVNLLPTIVWNWLRSFRRAKETAFFSLTQSLLLIGLNIWFIAFLKWGIRGFFLAQIISGTLMSVVSLFILKDWISLRFFDKKLLKQMLRYSLPLVPTAIALWGLNSAGGYFLLVYKGEAEVGLYQTGVTIAGIMTFVIGAFTQAWGPFAMSIREESGANAFYAKVFIFYLNVVGLLAVGIAVFSPEILKIITAPEYKEAHWVASILVFSSLLVGLNYIGSLGMTLVKNMRPFAMAFIIGSGINLFLYLAGSQYLGKEGCALASLLTNSGITIYIFRASQKMVFIPYNFFKGWLIILICIIVALISKFMVFNYFITTLIVKLIFCLVLFGLLAFVNRNEINQVLMKLKNKKQYS